MLYGIGCDLCELAHLEKSLTGAHAAAFVRRVYGEAERAALGLDAPLPAGRSAAHRLASAAANFAAKEAFLKAAGTGLREPFSLCEIEAIRQELQEGRQAEEQPVTETADDPAETAELQEQTCTAHTAEENLEGTRE